MRPIARAVDRLLRSLGVADDVAHVAAIDVWAGVATSVLGADATSTRAIRVEGTTLVVAVPTSAWASEIRLRETELVGRLAQAAPKSGVSSVRTVPTA